MVTATSAVDATKADSALVRVYNPQVTPPFAWSIITPATPAAISRDDGSPGVHSISIAARATLPTATLQNPFATGVEFWSQAVANGVWRRIGQSSSPTLIDNGVNRFWTFSIVWNPSATDAPFNAPSSTPLRILALGLTPAGNYSTPLNSNVTVTVP
jgi:hypothetical protein